MLTLLFSLVDKSNTSLEGIDCVIVHFFSDFDFGDIHLSSVADICNLNSVGSNLFTLNFLDDCNHELAISARNNINIRCFVADCSPFNLSATGNLMEISLKL